MWANDEIRQKTSTAGFFYLSAQHVLQQGGKVYGAAWTKDWHVHHIGIEKMEDLPLLCGSKYLQSNIENTYQEVKNDLDQGRKVLYSGCPCQIAGLYAYLGKNKYDTLFTIEVICHGVPSPKAFQKYIHDNFETETIKRIDFRDKTKYKWSSSANIFFNDGHIYRESAKQDSFYRAFLPCMILRRSCSVCPFSRLPRQADITIGDFWGIKAVDSSWHDKKGTELVLVNNSKGSTLFEKLSPLFQRYEKFPLTAAARINKTILGPFSAHPGRKHFFSAMQLKPFDQLVEDSLEHKYDVGIVGLWYGINYGSILTYYALYELMRQLGYDAVMLPKPPQLWDASFNDLNSIAQKFTLSHCNVFNSMKYPEEIYRMNDRCDSFVVGSDVVWNYEIVGKDVDQFFFLNWVEKGHKKIAFASSFGNTLTAPEIYSEKSKYYLQSFDKISIREKTGIDVIKELTSRTDIVQVLDPVFLCEKDRFDKCTEKIINSDVSNFVFAYLLNRFNKDLKNKVLEEICKTKMYQLRICGNPHNLKAFKEAYGPNVLPELTVEEWIWHIKKCSVFVGDSYHGLCFSLIYHKPFLIIYDVNSSENSRQRFESLLDLCGLSDRMLERSEMTVENYMKILDSPIDWNMVDQNLEMWRKKSIQWLVTALQEKKPKVTAKDIIENEKNRRLCEQNIQIRELKERVSKMEFQNSINHIPLIKKFFIYKRNNGMKRTIRKVGSYIKNRW